MAALRACMESLPPSSREVLDRFYFDDETTEKIAERLNKKNGAVRSAKFQISGTIFSCTGEGSATVAEQF